VRDDYATATGAARAETKGAGKPPRVRLVIANDDPNDPPETWLDRMARATLAGLEANIGANQWDQAKRVRYAYDEATAMLAEKRRRENKEVEE
jgi:hypothetical protein